MNPAEQNGASVAVAEEVYYPTDDGKPMAETEVHFRLMLRLVPILDQFFADRPDVHVGGNQFLYYQEGDSKKCTAPDIYVLKGVHKLPKLTSIKTWVEKTVPCFILELTSKSTAQEDQEEKKTIYQEIGVAEYFLFDPLQEYLPQPLMGYRLMLGQYEPLMASADGGLLSNQLQLRFVADGENLKVIDFRTGIPLKSPEEYQVLAELAEQNLRMVEQQREQEELLRQEAERQREEERRQRERAEQQRELAERRHEEEKRLREEAERQRAEERQQREKAEQQQQQAELRVAELAAELQRLRAQLPPSKPDPDQNA